MSKRKNKNSKYGTIILVIVVIVLIIFGIFALKYNLEKANKAKEIGNKIIELYTKAKK